MPNLAFITGGARSGKSGFAEARALEAAAHRAIDAVSYVATGEPMDEEFERRIEHHRNSRDRRFVTVEEGLDLVSALARARAISPVILLECLTTWLGNVFHHQPEDQREAFATAQIEGLLAAVAADSELQLFVVTNELGMGVVPLDAYTRHFCDVHGRLNRRLAEASSRAWLLVSGLPVTLKDR